MQNKIEFVRLVGDERRTGFNLSSVSRHWQDEKECFLFISPHDDDAVLGGGLLIQLAKRENVPVYILIVTDGSMGYCNEKEKDTIRDIRQKETHKCYQYLGVPKENIIKIGFPSGQINNYRGRTQVKSPGSLAIKGFTGLQNAFTYYLRQIKPTQCFLPTCNDLHPAHRIVYDEFLISLFHSKGDIWPELGTPLVAIPYIHEIAIYCDFIDSPTLRISTPVSYLENKLKAIGMFRSQKQISSIIENIRRGGPEEYLRAVEFKLYKPSTYHDMFEEKKTG